MCGIGFGSGGHLATLRDADATGEQASHVTIITVLRRYAANVDVAVAGGGNQQKVPESRAGVRNRKKTRAECLVIVFTLLLYYCRQVDCSVQYEVSCRVNWVQHVQEGVRVEGVLLEGR